jgi:hypothetical protein
VDGAIERLQVGAVDGDARVATPAAFVDRDVRARAFAGADGPQCRGAAVAEHGVGTAGEDGGEPARLAARRRVSDGVDAGVDSMQPSSAEPIVDRVR